MFTIDHKSELKLYGRKVGDQFNGDLISEDFAGYIFELTGGNDYQGFPMSKKHLTPQRVRPLLRKGDVGYRCRRDGERKRKSVRGAIVSEEINVLALVIVKTGEKDIEGITDVTVPKTHLPKRDEKLKEMFDIPEGADIAKFVEDKLKEMNKDDPNFKCPKIKPTGRIHRAKKEKIEKNKAMAKIRKEKALKEREEYIKKYGVLSN